jgi:VanZ family protein
VKRALRFALPPLLVAAGIFFLSSRPVLPAADIPHLDKVMHFSVYALLSWFTARALRAYGMRVDLAVLAAIAISAAYGLSDEIHQRYVPGRTYDLRDLVADVIGAATAALAWRARTRRSHTPASVTPPSR